MTTGRWLGRVLLAVAGAAAGLALGAVAAQAAGGSGGSTDSGYTVQASVRFSGDAAPGGGGTRVMGVPATCWWTIDTSIPFGDVEAVKAWYAARDAELTGTFSGAIGTYGPIELYVATAERQAAGDAVNWYKARCRDDTDIATVNDFVDQTYQWGVNGTVPVTYAPYPTGTPPQPQVDPEDLADLAYDEMVLVEPAVDRNPKADFGGGATFVGLDTWFWVTDPASVGGATGTRTIRAEVGTVWAEVTATTGGLTITSPAGGTSCSPAAAQVEWGDGGTGCTVAFSRASVGYAGGYPVEASAAWQAEWTSSTGAGGGLAGRTVAADTLVPVAESQALVTRGS